MNERISRGLPAQRAWTPLRRHTNALIVLGCALVASLVLHSTVTSFAFIWSDATDRPSYKHGYLIVGVCLWLLFRRRQALAAQPAQPAFLALPVLAGMSLLWAVADRSGLQIVGQALFPAMIWLAVVAGAGWKVARIAFFPIAFLYFAVPIWDVLMAPLRDFTTVVTGLVLASVGIPAWIEQNTVHIAAGTFAVEDGCSGLHYVVVALATATLYGSINGCSRVLRLKLLAIAAGLALLTNWVRVIAIVVAGHLTDMQHFLVKTDHYYFGWVLFLFALIAFMWLANRLTPPEAGDEAAPTLPADAPAAKPVGAVLALGALALGPATAWTSAAHDTPMQLPESSATGWILAGPYSGDWSPVYVEPDAQSHVSYREDATGSVVSVFSVAYRAQRQGHELVAYNNSLFGETGWRRDGRERAGVLQLGAQVYPYLETDAIDTIGRRHLVWWTYQVDERHFSSALRSKLWYGVASLWSDPAAVLFAVSAPCETTCEAAREGLTRYIKAVSSTSGKE